MNDTNICCGSNGNDFYSMCLSTATNHKIIECVQNTVWSNEELFVKEIGD